MSFYVFVMYFYVFTYVQNFHYSKVQKFGTPLFIGVWVDVLIPSSHFAPRCIEIFMYKITFNLIWKGKSLHLRDYKLITRVWIGKTT